MKCASGDAVSTLLEILVARPRTAPTPAVANVSTLLEILGLTCLVLAGF